MAYNWIKCKNSFMRVDTISEIFIDEAVPSEEGWDVGVRFTCGGISYIKRFQTKEDALNYKDTFFNTIIRPGQSYVKVYNAENLK